MNYLGVYRKSNSKNNLRTYLPISTNFSTLHVMVNSLRCAGPDSCVTVYSGKRQPFCTTNSYKKRTEIYLYILSILKGILFSSREIKSCLYAQTQKRISLTCRAPTGLHSACWLELDNFISDWELQETLITVNTEHTFKPYSTF